jgi:adenosylhomocysteine nucleosidase
MLALLGALREEIIDLQKQMGLDEISVWQGYRIAQGKYENRGILLIQTGIGKNNAERAVELVLSYYPSIATILSIGFGGALTERLRVGDVIICSTLHCADELQIGSGRNLASDTHLVSVALECAAATRKLRSGSSVTSAQLALKPGEKLELGRAFNADIVDMESYWVAKAAAEKHVPFICIRAVSDAVHESSLPFDLLLAPDGKLRQEETAIHMLAHPHHLVRLLATYQNTRRARRSLTNYICCFLTRL